MRNCSAPKGTNLSQAAGSSLCFAVPPESTSNLTLPCPLQSTSRGCAFRYSDGLRCRAVVGLSRSSILAS